jgi:hypothetical protein
MGHCESKSRETALFLPVARMATGGEEYCTQALGADASATRDWGKLTIEGDRWVYSWENKETSTRFQGQTKSVLKCNGPTMEAHGKYRKAEMSSA